METNQNTHPAGNRELVFALISAVCALFLTNMTLFGGFNLGFSIAVILSILCAAGYLLRNGCKKSPYALSILGLCLVIAGSFARSDDTFVKFVMVCFLLVGVNLGLGILAGKNRRDPGTAASLADAGFVLFGLGFGELPASTKGLGNAFRSSGSLGRKGGAVLLGLCFALPVLLLMIPLLMGADAAFEGLLDKLPAFDLAEFLSTLVLGAGLTFILYTRGTALRFYEEAPREVKTQKGLPALTVNTLLVTVVFVYCVYLVSQLAYFTGGFAGLLPEDYTLAEYARRGFFEMAALCCVNLGIMVFSLSLCRDGAPKSTRFLCLFIGLVTVFLVSTASAKMLLYIGSFGLTRLRVLTQVIMLFLAVVTILVSIWLFVPRLPYMKAVVLVALAMGAVVSWVDVDTFVARYNTEAYLDGRMEEIDMAHMGSLGAGALPYIHRLYLEAEDSFVWNVAEDLINYPDYKESEDWRSWNYVNLNIEKYSRKVAREERFSLWEIFFPEPVYDEIKDDHGGFHGDGMAVGVAQFAESDVPFLMEQMADSQGWQALPITENLQLLLDNYLTGYDVDSPIVRHGYYYFYDRHGESADPYDDSEIFDRYSYNLDFAIFDAETGMLYYWGFDT